MSDRPSDLDFKLQHIVIAVQDVGEWYDLGLQLGLPDSSLAAIRSHPDVSGHKRLMLSEWLKRDTEASWDKLSSALSIIGENVVSANIRSRFMKAAATTPGPVVDASNEDDKTCQEMTQTVLQKIKGQFASLQVEVRLAMEARQVKVMDAHQFLVSFFQSESCIPEASNLTKLFNIVTEAKLWRYDHFSPLRELAEKFLPENNPARKLVSEYKNQLSGFYTTTKIIDFIDLSELDDAEDDSDSDSEDGAKQSLSPKEYKKLYRELKVTLKLDRKIKLSDMTMSYVDTLWKALIEEFDLPPLTAIIKKIVGGSLIITWLIPPQVSSVIAASKFMAFRFYQQHNIARVELDSRVLYTEEWRIGKRGSEDLIEACQYGHIKRAMELLDHGENVNYQDWNGRSALWHASNAGNMECVKVLLKYGAQVDLPDNGGGTALITASRRGYVEVARILLDHGASIDHQDKDRVTSLNEACYKGKSETVSLLLKAGAKIDIQDTFGVTGLYWAASGGYVNIVQMMVDHGAAVDLARHDGGSTCLMAASGNGHVDTVRVLLKTKPDPNITDENGETALHRAALCGSVEVVKMLVNYGTAVDIRNQDGETALHRAALHGRVEVVKMLVDYGAAVDFRNKDGLTALDIARGQGYQAVCEVLEKHTKEETSTQEQRESFYQRLLKTLERTFLKEQAKKERKGTAAE